MEITMSKSNIRKQTGSGGPRVGKYSGGGAPRIGMPRARPLFIGSGDKQYGSNPYMSMIDPLNGVVLKAQDILGKTKKRQKRLKLHKDYPMSNFDLLDWCKYLKIAIKNVLSRDETIPHNHKGRPKKGGSVDIDRAIGKLPKPKGGWTLPGHKYTGPYNDLENQVRYNPKAGEILEIYDPPTGKTDAIAMQHDVDYAVRKDDKKCKHIADRKMVKALDAVPWNER